MLASPGAGSHAETARLNVCISGCSCDRHTSSNAVSACSPCRQLKPDRELEGSDTAHLNTTQIHVTISANATDN